MSRAAIRPHWKGGPAVALIGAALLALALFLLIPLTQILDGAAKPDLAVREMITIQPPVAESPPAPEDEPPPEEEPPPEFERNFQELSLNQLELALEPGIGDALSMGVRMGNFATETDVMADIEQVFSFSDLPNAPRLLGVPRINFPQELARRGVREGTVTLAVIIDEKGFAQVERVISSTHAGLEAEALNVARRARFSPPEIDGRPVKVRGEWPLTLRAP